jgi:hypothetical protein
MKIYQSEKDANLDFITESAWASVDVTTVLDNKPNNIAQASPALMPSPHLAGSNDLLQIYSILSQ